MRTKVTLVLVLLNVVLFYYIFYHELPAQDARRLLEGRRRVLPAEVASLDSFTRSGRTTPTLSARKDKETTNWWVTQPVEWPANRNAIDSICNALQTLEHETSFAVADLAKSGQSLADYGLADPALVFTFTAASKTFTLKIGDNTKIGNRLFVLSPDGARIHVVNRSLAETLGLTLDQLRAPSIFTIPVFEVRSLSLQTTTPANLKVRLRRENSRWAFEAPILARADKAKLDLTLNALTALQTKKFLEARDAELDRLGLTSPALRITLEGNSRRETLLLGNPVTATPAPDAEEIEYYAKIEDKAAIFTTLLPTKNPSDLLKQLRNAQETLRDTHILDFEPRTVTALTLTAPGQPELNLQRLEAQQGWQLVVRGANGQPPQTLPADSSLVSDLLQKLQLLTTQKFLSDAPSAADLENFGFNRPEREITLALNTGGGPHGTDASTLTLRVGVTPGQHDTAYARVANAPFLYQIDPEVLEITPSLARHYRQRLLRELPEGARITGVKLTELPANTTIVEAAHATALTPEALAATPLSAPARTALAALLGQLRALRAQRFTADTFTADHAEDSGQSHPWKYRLDVTLALTGGDGGATTTTSSLLLTERLGGTTQLAGTAEFGGVSFALTQEMIDALFALTYGEKTDPGPPAADTPATPKPPQS